MKHLHIVLAALVGLSLAAAPAHAAEPTRVMVVGDSISQGADGDFTWRYFAASQLPSVEWVGNRVGTFVDAEHTWDGTYADPAFDSDHASRWGLALWEMLHQPSERAPRIGELVAAHDPDVIVEALGTNDFAWLNRDVESMSEQVREFVAEARSVKPDVDVILAPVAPTWVVHAEDYNAALPALAAELSTDASRVVAAPGVGMTKDDTSDGIHPSTDGQRKIAASMVAGMVMLVDSPVEPAPEPEPAPEVTPPAEAPMVVEPVAAPSKPRGVRAVRKGRRVVVSWQRARGADRYVARCGTKVRRVERVRTSMRVRASRCKVRSVSEGGASGWRVVRVRR